MAARVFKVEFRIAVAQRILNGESVSSLSRQYKIKRSLLYRWRDAYREMGTAGFGRPRGPRPGAKRNAIAKPSTTADERIVELERRLDDEGQTKRTPVKTGSSPVSCASLMGYCSSVPGVTAELS